MPGLKSRVRTILRSAAEEALGTHIRELTEGGANAVNLGRTLSILNECSDLPSLRDYGFRVFSQFGEDGVIQHLLSKIRVPSDRFVEIGVQDYSESNTRFLALKDDWRGLIIDAGPEAGDFLLRTGLGTMRNIEFRQSFVTAENVNELLKNQPRDLGLLSIDVDGMDYWIWKAIAVVSPALVVIEYQNAFGPDEAIVIPYRPDFDRWSDPNGGCYGASLAALGELGRAKGYRLVGTSDGPNAFFVRDDLLGSLRPVTSRECYREARYRDSPELPMEMSDRRRAMADGEVFDARSGERRPLRSYRSLFPND